MPPTGDVTYWTRCSGGPRAGYTSDCEQQGRGDRGRPRAHDGKTMTVPVSMTSDTQPLPASAIKRETAFTSTLDASSEQATPEPGVAHERRALTRISTRLVRRLPT